MNTTAVAYGGGSMAILRSRWRLALVALAVAGLAVPSLAKAQSGTASATCGAWKHNVAWTRIASPWGPGIRIDRVWGTTSSGVNPTKCDVFSYLMACDIDVSGWHGTNQGWSMGFNSGFIMTIGFDHDGYASSYDSDLGIPKNDVSWVLNANYSTRINISDGSIADGDGQFGLCVIQLPTPFLSGCG